jgi:signal transduction histidine kinase
VRQDYTDGPVASDIRAELETVLPLFRNKTKGEVAIERDYAADSVVQGRPSELNQVWINRIDNALKAMSYKGSLRVATEERGDWLAVMVGDSGPGIPPEIGQRVFEPFFSTRIEGAGMGLGLDIARGGAA